MRLDPYDKRHLQNVEAYLKKLDQIYANALGKVAQIGSKVTSKGKLPYNFSISPYKKQLDAIYNQMAKDMEATIFNGIGAEWKFGDKKAIDQAMSALKGKISKEAFEKASGMKFGSTDAALKNFLNRKDQCLEISDSVWRYRDQFKNEMEMALQVGIKDGTPAKKLASEMKQYLQEPDKLFRRHRDEFGVLQASKNMKAFHPGQGVYKSSYKNACRLTRTEVNMAYRGAESTRYQRLPFVRGFEVNLSNAHPQVDICDDLKGKYPADFVYKGWHPQCLCYTTPIMVSDDDFDKLQDDIMSGKDIFAFQLEKDRIQVPIPNGFSDWINRNKERSIDWKSQPYFIKDNFSGGYISGGLKSEMNAQLKSVSATTSQMKYISDARNNSPLFDFKSRQLANDLGILVTPVSNKGVPRIFEKAVNDYNGDIFEVKDIIRNTFIAEEKEIQSIIDSINKEFDVVKYKQHLKDVEPLGYSGNLFQVRLQSGAMAEVQVNTPQMIYAKESKARELLGDKLYNEIKMKSGLESGLGHKYYEEFRSLTSIHDAARKAELIKLSKAYYNKIRQIRLD